jgi:GNAT superfamily N-acetyltransferase
VTLVAILTVRREALHEFRAFERHAAAIMRAHGGRIERTVVVAAEPASSLVKEIHLVTFPDEPAFRAYRSDPRLAELAHLREVSVVATQVLIGEEGPDYLAEEPHPAPRRHRATGPLRLRDAGPGDRDAIREVTLAAYAEYAPLMPALWNDYRNNILGTLASPAPAEQIVAEHGGAIVGAVLLYPAGVEWPGVEAGRPQAWPEVRLLAVAPASRGLGVGMALMQECVRRARVAGAPALALHTIELMRAAVRLYGRLGFAREPGIDFRVAPSLMVMGYRLDLG